MNTRFAKSSKELEDAIVSTLAYFDVFDHPLRLSEIYRFLPLHDAELSDVYTACRSESLKKRIADRDHFYFLRHRSSELASERLHKERRARRLWRIALLMSSIVRRFPFIRGIFVSGELSKGVAGKDSDIDFFIVTAENRVWISRTLFALFKRVFLFNSHKFFCYNHISSERDLEILDRNQYTAIEVVTTRPIFNIPLYNRFRKVNNWSDEFLPHAIRSKATLVDDRVTIPMLEKLVSFLLPDHSLDALDGWLLERWSRSWKRRYPQLDAADLNLCFQCTPDRSTAYAGNFLPKVMNEYHSRIKRFSRAPRAGDKGVEMPEQEFQTELST